MEGALVQVIEVTRAAFLPSSNVPSLIRVDTDDYSIWYSFMLSILMFPFCR